MGKWITAVALMVVLVGCSQRLGDLTVASNKNIVVSSFDPSTMDAQDVVGKECKGNILGIPLGIPTVEGAIDDAFRQSGGNLMTDAVLTQTFWTAIIYGQTCIKAEGKAWAVRVGMLESDWIERLADSEASTPVSVGLADGSVLSGDLVAVTRDRVAIRSDGEIRWIALDQLAEFHIGE